MGSPTITDAKLKVQNTKVEGVDSNRDGSIDQVRIKESKAGKTTHTGIYNVHTEEGRKAFTQALLDLGLSMPEFMAGADSKFMASLPSSALDELKNLATTAGSMTSSNTQTPTVTAQLQGRWANFIAKCNIGEGMDVNALVQYVLREAYMENTKDLHFYAQKVRHYNELKKKVREELTKAREFLAQHAGKKPEDKIDWNKYTNSTGGKGPLEFTADPVINPKTGAPEPKAPTSAAVGSGDGKLPKNKEGLTTYIRNLEEFLNSAGEDAQLANVDLQNMLQKQQQTLQMMSNISKMLHDTAMAIIRKIGA